MADYYRHKLSGAIHRKGCKFAHSRHGAPWPEMDGKTHQDILVEAEIERRLNFINFCHICMPEARHDLRFWKATTDKKQLGD